MVPVQQSLFLAFQHITSFFFYSKSSQFVRVVKEVDSKSTGFTRIGSNPVADDFYH